MRFLVPQRVVILVSLLVISACNAPSDHRSSAPMPVDDTSLDAANTTTLDPYSYDAHVWENIVNFKLTALKENDEDLASRPNWWYWYHRTTFQNGVALKNAELASRHHGDIYCDVVWKSKFLRGRKRFKVGQVTMVTEAKTNWSFITSTLKLTRGTATAKDGSRIRTLECTKYGKDPLTVADAQRTFGAYLRIDPK